MIDPVQCMYDRYVWLTNILNYCHNCALQQIVSHIMHDDLRWSSHLLFSRSTCPSICKFQIIIYLRKKPNSYINAITVVNRASSWFNSTNTLRHWRIRCGARGYRAARDCLPLLAVVIVCKCLWKWNQRLQHHSDSVAWLTSAQHKRLICRRMYTKRMQRYRYDIQNDAQQCGVELCLHLRITEHTHALGIMHTSRSMCECP